MEQWQLISLVYDPIVFMQSFLFTFDFFLETKRQPKGGKKKKGKEGKKGKKVRKKRKER